MGRNSLSASAYDASAITFHSSESGRKPRNWVIAP